MKKWNFRYVHYAAEQGRSPEAQLEHDIEKYPGGRMTGFLLWISARWAEWSKHYGPAAATKLHESGLAQRDFDLMLERSLRETFTREQLDLHHVGVELEAEPPPS